MVRVIEDIRTMLYPSATYSLFNVSCTSFCSSPVRLADLESLRRLASGMSLSFSLRMSRNSEVRLLTAMSYSWARRADSERLYGNNEGRYST